VNCCVSPTATVGLVGVKAIETKVAGNTVRTTGEEVTPPNAAVMDEVPVTREVANPAELTVATDGLLEVQVT
jgi:hypothetical protein